MKETDDMRPQLAADKGETQSQPNDAGWSDGWGNGPLTVKGDPGQRNPGKTRRALIRD